MAVVYLGKQSINFVTDQYNSFICASCTAWVSTSPYTPQSHSPHIFKSGTHSIHAEILSKSDIQFFENEPNGRLTSPLCNKFIHSVQELFKHDLFLHMTPTKHHSNCWLFKPEFLLLIQNPRLVTLTGSVKVPKCDTPYIAYCDSRTV
jgi:hypothetical protein